MENLKSIIETLIFTTDTPLQPSKIIRVIENNIDEDIIHETIEQLNHEYYNTGRVFQIELISKGYCITTRKEFFPYVKKLYEDKTKYRLSRSALECLAIIAVKQPATRIDVERVRGVNSSGTIHSLLEKELITIKGTKKVPGNPKLYCTTDNFLKQLGINQISDLPDYSKIIDFIKNSKENIDIQEAIEEQENLFTQTSNPENNEDEIQN